VDCASNTWDLNTTSLEKEGYDVSDSFTLATLLAENYGSVEAATTGLLANCTAGYGDIVTFLNDTETVLRYEPDGLKDIVEGIELSSTKYEAAAVIALFGGLFVAVYIAGVLIPSFITTVLKFRSGVLPTLRDRDFQRMRVALDAVTVLLGSCFWSALFSSGASSECICTLYWSVVLSSLTCCERGLSNSFACVLFSSP